MENQIAREIKINRSNPNSVSPTHVNDMLVTHDSKEFFLQFLEIEPPAFLDKEELDSLESVQAIVKVKLVMSPEFLEAMIKALSDTFEKYKLNKKEISK